MNESVSTSLTRSAASVQGAVLFGTDAKPVTRPRVKLSDLQRAKR